MKRFFDSRRIGLCLLLLVTILLCNAVQIHLDIREHQRLAAQLPSSRLISPKPSGVPKPVI